MLIICTKDNNVIQAAQAPGSGANQWGALNIINAGLNQVNATAALGHLISQLQPGEALCLSAHGNNVEIGDAGGGPNDWSWTCAAVAQLLSQNAPAHYAGPILIHACAQNVANFSAGLAVALENIRALNRVWCFGYNLPVPVNTGYPNPANLAVNLQLQGSQVVYRVMRHGEPAGCACYTLVFPSGHQLQVPVGFDLEEARKVLTLLATSTGV